MILKLFLFWALVFTSGSWAATGGADGVGIKVDDVDADKAPTKDKKPDKKKVSKKKSDPSVAEEIPKKDPKNSTNSEESSED